MGVLLGLVWATKMYNVRLYNTPIKKIIIKIAALLDIIDRALEQAHSSDQRFNDGGKPIFPMHMHIKRAMKIGLTVIEVIARRRVWEVIYVLKAKANIMGEHQPWPITINIAAL